VGAINRPTHTRGKAQAAENARAFYGWTAELAALRDEIRANNRYMAELMRQRADLLRRLS
jgi:hypothetical protein